MASSAQVAVLSRYTDTYKEQTMPVIEHYQKLGKVMEVS